MFVLILCDMITAMQPSRAGFVCLPGVCKLIQDKSTLVIFVAVFFLQTLLKVMRKKLPCKSMQGLFV